MDQSRSRHTAGHAAVNPAALHPPIIERPDLQTAGHRTISGVVTLVFWAIWLYLWLPLLALIAWAAGIEQAYKYMIALGGYEEVFRLISIYTVVVLAMGGSLVIWATYNIERYGRLPKRSGNRVPTLAEVARDFRQGPQAVERWRVAQRLYVVHDENGDIARVDVIGAGGTVPDFRHDEAATA